MCSSATVLDYIADNPGCQTSEIASAMGEDVLSVSRKVTRLVGQGRVRREPKNLRGVARNQGYRLWVVE